MDLELRTQLFIGNEFTAAADNSTFPVENPADASLLAEVSEAKEADIDRAVQAARAAFGSSEWQKRSPRDRGALLYRFADLVDEHADELATIQSLENGKTYFESRKIDLPEVATVWAWWAASCPGTSRSRWPLGRSRRRSPAGTPWCSSRRRTPRSAR
jgi:acyl-CoA reductase-like NAD-dependent aldehyde dehydrogenase